MSSPNVANNDAKKPEQTVEHKVEHKPHHRHKKHDDHDDPLGGHGEEHGEPWLMSYADMMTLLFCFFVIMTSFGRYDSAEVAKLSKAIANYTSDGEIDKEENKLKNLEQDVSSNPQLQGVAMTKVQEGAMELVFTTTVLYPKGGKEAEEGFYKNIDVLVGLIKNRSADYRIIIEGHTDANDSERQGEGEQLLSSWAVSSMRAAKVVDRFIYQGFNANQLVSVGYGDARPVAQSFDKKGRVLEDNGDLNRRIAIKVLQPIRGKKIKNLKMENYFENEEILDAN